MVLTLHSLLGNNPHASGFGIPEKREYIEIIAIDIRQEAQGKKREREERGRHAGQSSLPVIFESVTKVKLE